MLDTQRPEHLTLAVQITAELDDRVWERAAVPYAMACIASRNGQVRAAIVHAREAVSHGCDATIMLRDTDFANVLADPETGAELRALAG